MEVLNCRLSVNLHLEASPLSSEVSSLTDSSSVAAEGTKLCVIIIMTVGIFEVYKGGPFSTTLKEHKLSQAKRNVHILAKKGTIW